MPAMLTSDATFSMEMFPFGHCPEGNSDVSSVCFVEMHRGIAWDMVKNPSSQTLPLFEEFTPPLAYPEEVEETLRTLIEEEPMDQTQLEDVGFDSPDYNLSLSSREVPSFDGLEPQP
ncbi:hypothetical protein Tco_0811259 [Tanacetum coccineum]